MDQEAEIQSLKELVATLTSQVNDLTQQASAIGFWGGLWNFVQNEALAIAALIVTVVFTLLRFRQQRIFALEKNMDVLQRLNEVALANDSNLKAALTSVKDVKDFDPNAAREVFFHWHRINRMYRAWYLWQRWVIRNKDYEAIVKNYATTLKLKAGPQLAALGQRGYEEKFIRDLTKAIGKSDPPEDIDVSGKSGAQGDTTSSQSGPQSVESGLHAVPTSPPTVHDRS